MHVSAQQQMPYSDIFVGIYLQRESGAEHVRLADGVGVPPGEERLPRRRTHGVGVVPVEPHPLCHEDPLKMGQQV